jgi:hypothetical protein
MEADFNQLAQRLDDYPNFAVDLAARMPYLVMRPRADMIAFIEKYQDRLLYATDNEFSADAKRIGGGPELGEYLRIRLAIFRYQRHPPIQGSQSSGAQSTGPRSTQALSPECGSMDSRRFRA